MKTAIKIGRRSVLGLMCSVIGLPIASANQRVQSTAVYAGGVTGVANLDTASNSEIYRSLGGGLYLHNSGWNKLTLAQRRHILEIFHGAPTAIELGFGSGPAWGKIFQERYAKLGIIPTFIAVNAFSHNNHPTIEHWSAYSASLRKYGVAEPSLILPTFEYPNFRENISKLRTRMISRDSDFQEILRYSRGIVLDTPSAYAMARENAYREWIVDAVLWTKSHNLESVMIISPGASGNNWLQDTVRYVRYLASHEAIPSAFVCENYTNSLPYDYPNAVGSENDPENVLGVALQLMQHILPGINPS